MAESKKCRCWKTSKNACPACVHEKIKKLVPGDTLTLKPGPYDTALSLNGIRGDANNKITIRGQGNRDKWHGARKSALSTKAKNFAVLTSGYTAAKYRTIANRLARKKQASGEFPGLYYVADEASLRLQDCQHVEIENLFFDNCWPTAMYLDNCQDIAITDCRILWGTFAIGATGIHTRHILVERCHWQQNVANNGNWADIAWKTIHADIGDYGGNPVNLENDWRMFDGDFFVAWSIAGFVTLRNNVVSDAFNAIHFFNRPTKNPNRAVSKNIVIEGNTFERIRDNAIEPEDGAWNWVIRHNKFIDIYRVMSWELTRSGYFYVYGNLFWHTQRPGAGKDDDKAYGSIFKFSRTHHMADGPHYIFHNSFYLRERIAKKGRFSNFHFINNAGIYTENDDLLVGDPVSSLYGSNGGIKTPYNPVLRVEDKQLQYEKNRFTKAWTMLNISFDYNIIGHPQKYKELKALNYDFGEHNSNLDPGFSGPFEPQSISEYSFMLTNSPDAKAKKASGEFTLEITGWQVIKVSGDQNIGAFQQDGKLFEFSSEIEWIKPPFPGDDPAYPKKIS